jgi:hypothetical protein
MYLRIYCFTPCFDQFSRNIISTWGILTFQLSNSNFISTRLGSGTNGSAVCISICLISWTPCTFSTWLKKSFQLFKKFWGFASGLPFSSFIILILGCYPFLNSFLTLYRSLMILFLLLVSSSLILPFKYSLYFFPNILGFHVLNFSDYLYWFGLDFANIVI